MVSSHALTTDPFVSAKKKCYYSIILSFHSLSTLEVECRLLLVVTLCLNFSKYPTSFIV